MARPRNKATSRSMSLKFDLKNVSLSDEYLACYDLFVIFENVDEQTKDKLYHGIENLIERRFEECLAAGLTEEHFVFNTLRSIASSLVRSCSVLDRDAVSDIVNDAFEKRVWIPGKYDPNTPVGYRTAYLKKAVTQEFIDHFRRAQKLREREQATDDETLDALREKEATQEVDEEVDEDVDELDAA